MSENGNGYSKRWLDLLEEAVREPGRIHQCYSVFHGYSIGNQFLALVQCYERGLKPGPIGTFLKWKELGRSIKGGEKAIYLWLPITIKEKDDDGEETGKIITIFQLKPRWFVYDQTRPANGDEKPLPDQITPDWSLLAVLDGLGIKHVDFDEPDGNVQGFARRREFAVNPVAAMPIKTTLHEIAHIALGHTEEGPIVDHKTLTRNIREVEAESVAMIVLDALGKEPESQVYSRGYIQNWMTGDEIPEASAKRIFAAADKILRAGRGDPVDYAKSADRDPLEESK